ncbi:hypothetical protein [Tepidibacter formicigenes]|jgi:hypothetical protein|uniref:Uncharacterized protein n=1 Tax=Tepidibacter formicigenes DSM 15518 TaxID=1123349 RepID=A0A1M6SNN2_9FIRM|nr:hypothetical protein [Tepidibacter formicigenes]SHK46218.1 hypothetical protein SAMN02744037_02390 [Tepidibacter formicigenes DSM 15518]
MELAKRQMLETQMKTFIKCVLDAAEREEKLDYINIEISNHNGNLQMDYTLRNRKKAY